MIVTQYGCTASAWIASASQPTLSDVVLLPELTGQRAASGGARSAEGVGRSRGIGDREKEGPIDGQA